MSLSADAAIALVQKDLLPKMVADQAGLDRIDQWMRWEHESPHAPRTSTEEYRELASRAPTPWLRLVVSSVVQSLYVDGYRSSDATEESAAWEWWQRNGMDRRQIAVHRAAVGYGLAYATVLPGTDSFGEAMPIVRGVSPRRMMAYYSSPADDDWPVYALRSDPTMIDGQASKVLRLYDANEVHFLTSSGDKVLYNGSAVHGIGVCPVVRYSAAMDLEGRADGEVEPYISTAARIDQTSFDRLVVQRFSSWVVRTIAGLSLNETVSATNETTAQAKLRLKVEDLLVAEDKDTKFGSLPATPLDGFIAAKDADIRDLSAVSQTPPHHLLGQIANLSADALVAAETSHSRKIEEQSTSLGQSHEQMLRLCARVAGDSAGARDMASQVRWRDTSGRSLAQAADALGKLADMLSVPVELLWEKIPGWTQQDVERAKELAADGGGLNQLLGQLVGAQTPSEPAPA